MEQRVSLVTLGVADVARARAFYEAMGWRPAMALDEVVFFQAGGMIVSLWRRAELARDVGAVDSGAAFGGMALAHNVRSAAEVDAVLATAQAAGGSLLRAARHAEWGGYSGYFADVDGHAWEVAWNPGFPLDADGTVRVPTGGPVSGAGPG